MHVSIFYISLVCVLIFLKVPYILKDYGFQLSLKELTIKKLGLTEQKLKVTSVKDKGDAQVVCYVHMYSHLCTHT